MKIIIGALTLLGVKVVTLSWPVTSFHIPSWSMTTATRRQVGTQWMSSSPTTKSTNDETVVPNDDDQDDEDLSSWRASVIQQELQQLGVSYADCFDKDSLVQRLRDARRHGPAVSATTTTSPPPLNDTTLSSAATKHPEPPTTTSPSSSSPPGSANNDEADDAALRQRLHNLSIKELRHELAARNLRWAGLLEKRDLVQAVYDAMRAAMAFSATGRIPPGQVANLNEHEVRREMHASLDSGLVVDAYATWCGPCQLLAPQLSSVAANLPHVRFAKLDTDQYPQLSSQLHVQGLPTLILYRHGQEVDRVEGALMKEQLQQWIEAKL